jgi:tRNA nucleotidyltransferase (CCA-adding enzyme)
VLTGSGNKPISALHLIDRLGLYSTIFTDPTAQSPPTPSPVYWSMLYGCLETLEANKTPGSIYQSLVRSDDERYYAWILAALTPLSAIPNPQPERPGAKSPLPFATNVAREGIKAENKVCNVVTAAFRNANAITNLKISIVEMEEWTLRRDTLGMLIRKWDSQGGHWRVQVLFALLAETRSKTDTWLRPNESFIIGSYHLAQLIHPLIYHRLR